MVHEDSDELGGTSEDGRRNSGASLSGEGDSGRGVPSLSFGRKLQLVILGWAICVLVGLMALRGIMEVL